MASVLLVKSASHPPDTAAKEGSRKYLQIYQGKYILGPPYWTLKQKKKNHILTLER